MNPRVLKSIFSSLAIFLLSAFWVCGGDASKLFESVDVSKPVNAVSAISDSTSLTDFLEALFEMSFSQDKLERRFGGENITEISTGSLLYSHEFGLSEKDWNMLVDGYLIDGYLRSKDEKRKLGFEILMWRRPTAGIQAFILVAKIPQPDFMNSAPAQ